MSDQLRKFMAPMEQRIRLMVGRAIVRLVKDTAKAQELQLELLDGESQDGVERFQNYGFTAHPHPGAEALVTFTGGLRSHGIVVAVEDRRYRLKGLQQGEVAIYDDLGNQVLLGRDGIKVTAVTRCDVEAPIVKIDSSDIRLGGDGGQKVARIGDDVDPMTNKIISGSDKVTAA